MSYRILLDSKYGIEEIYERTKNNDYLQGEWLVCRNIADFSRLITTNQLDNDIMPELISWEFNLGFDILDKGINPKAETGADAIKWLVEFCLHRRVGLPTWIIHTESLDHKRNMDTILSNSKDIYKL